MAIHANGREGARARARERLEAITAELDERDPQAPAAAPARAGRGDERTRGFERATRTRVAAIAGLSPARCWRRRLRCLRSHGQRPGDSIGAAAPWRGCASIRGRSTLTSQRGPGQRSSRCGPVRESARPPEGPGQRPGEVAGGRSSAPVTSETAPPAPEPAAVPQPAIAARSRLLRSGAAQLAPSDLHPGEERRRGGLPTRVRLRVLVVREGVSASGPRLRPAPGSHTSRSPCWWRQSRLRPGRAAGPYDAVQCAAHLGAGHGGFHFSRNSPDFHRVRACGSGDGLGVTHERSRTGPGRYGAWVAKPPAGTYFTRGRLMARGRRGDAYRPRLLLGAPRRGARDSIGSPRRGFRTFEWRARSRADRLIAELTCARRTDRCRRADEAEDLRQAGTVPPLRCLAAGRERVGRRAARRARAARHPGAYREGSRRRLRGPAGCGAHQPQAL